MSKDMKEEHFEGIGCNCEAWSRSECCCAEADWRSTRAVQLEDENIKLRNLLVGLYSESYIESVLTDNHSWVEG